ncbi:unnamed protein product [Blepharisma stoltei]|uniref:Uncharacterized protein n=1 Tax=Blepharisma stoltei TaxID=1481888 RepID=A0AAU9JHK6_9CILI|nr:unnamed protein product [Blepharisma stoltei]
MPEINSLKDTSSAAAKLYNWNVLIRALETVGVTIDSDMKALIVAGDRAMVTEVLKSLYETEQRVMSKDSSQIIAKKKKFKPKISPDGALLLDNVEVECPLDEAQSSLEFLILSLCQSFQLTIKQSAGLLTQNGKFLNQVLVKGLRGQFYPVISWYEKLTESADILARLIEKEIETGALTLVMDSIKPGLQSKDVGVVKQCCKFLERIKTYLRNEEDQIVGWFLQDPYTQILKGLDFFKVELTNYVADIFVEYGRYRLIEFFGEKLQQYYGEMAKYFNSLLALLPYMISDMELIAQLEIQGLVKYWVEVGLRESEADPDKVSPKRLSALAFICDIWCMFPVYIENNEETANSILTILKRACREKSRGLKIFCFGRLFALLSSFSACRNSYAPIIYKTLTFSLVENYSFDRLREFMLSNFIVIFEEIQSLPIGILMEPVSKQFQVLARPKYNTTDFDYYIACARHPMLTLKHAVLAIDVLGRIYLNDVAFAKAAEIPFMLMAGRFIDSNPMQEYLTKFFNLGLKLLYTKMKEKTESGRESPTKDEIEDDRSFRHMKNLILGLIEKILRIGNSDMNSLVKDILVFANGEVKRVTGLNMRGIMGLLEIIGDPAYFIESYETSQRSIVPVSDSGRNYPSSLISRSAADTVSDINKGTMTTISNIPRGRVLSDIAKLKQKRVEKEAKERAQSEQRKRDDERKKRALRNQIEKRRIALGVEGKNDDQPVFIKEPIILANEISIKPVNEETEDEQEMINIIMKKYTRVSKLLYNKYAGTVIKPDVLEKETFDSINKRVGLMTEGQVTKLLREQGITNSMISTEDIKRLYAMIIHANGTVMDFDNFMQFMYQLSLIIYSKFPNTLSQFPAAICMNALYEHMKNSSAGVAVPKYLYEEPDPGAGDREVVAMLNDLLLKDPSTEIPEGYKKVKDKELKILYEVPSELGLPESQKICAEIVDSIIFDYLNTHFLQPVIKIETYTRARGVLTKPQIQEKSPSLGVPAHKAAYKALPLPAYLKLTPGIKITLNKLSPYYSNDLLLECARVLDDLVYTVDSNNPILISRNPKAAGSVPNRITEQREYEVSQAKTEQEKAEAKRKQRKQILEEQLRRERMEKEMKQKEEEEAKRREEELTRQRKKREKEQKEKEKAEIDKKIKEFHSKKDEEEAKKRQEEIQAKLSIEEKKKKEREEFLKVINKRLTEVFDKKKEEKKNLVVIEENKVKENIVRKEAQRRLSKIALEDGRAKREEERKINEKISLAIVDEEVQNLFSEYAGGLEVLFNYYCKAASSVETLPLAGFNKFVGQFNICPILLSNDEAIKIYRYLTKHKESVLELNLDEFKEAMIRISFQAKSILEQEVEKSLDTNFELMKSFFNWILIPKETAKALDFMKKLTATQQILNPRDKKRLKNTLLKSVSEGISEPLKQFED